MTDEHEHEFRDRPYTPEEGMSRLHQAIIHHGAYPQGNPRAVKVELSDEHWNAICLSMQMVIIAQFTEGNRIVPDFLIEQMHQGYHAIHDAVSDSLGEAVVEELIQEVQGEQGQGV